jgi:hypothetical protein
MIRTPALLKSENHSMVVRLGSFSIAAFFLSEIVALVEVSGSAPFALFSLDRDDMTALYISSNKVFEVTKHLSLDRPTVGW